MEWDKQLEAEVRRREAAEAAAKLQALSLRDELAASGAPSDFLPLDPASAANTGAESDTIGPQTTLTEELTAIDLGMWR